MTKSPYYKRTIVKEEMTSDILGEDRSLRVLLPPDYDETKTYPVIYCQDGEQFFNYGRIATIATQLMTEGEMSHAIIAGIDVILKTRTEDYSPDGKRFEKYCRFVTEEAIPLIEQKYAVSKEPSGRIAAGDSLGGTVSLHLALDYPELFAKVLSLSGAFLNPTFERMKQADDLTGLDIYMLIGTEETEVKTDRGTYDFLKVNRDLKPMLENKGAVVKYVEKEGKHIWGFWQKELPDALKYFLGTEK